MGRKATNASGTRRADNAADAQVCHHPLLTGVQVSCPEAIFSFLGLRGHATPFELGVLHSKPAKQKDGHRSFNDTPTYKIVAHSHAERIPSMFGIHTLARYVWYQICHEGQEGRTVAV
jgi:hypothetical protein